MKTERKVFYFNAERDGVHVWEMYVRRAGNTNNSNMYVV